MLVHLGAQGWMHPEWVETFYPRGTAPADMLRCYAAEVSAVEVEFEPLRLPPVWLIRDWVAQVPPEFRFAVRVPLAFTHEREWTTGDSELARFVDRVRLFGENRGPLLVRVPRAFRHTDANRARLGAFVAGLDRDLSWVFEFRLPEWLDARVDEILASIGAARALGDLAPDSGSSGTVAYLRLSGRGSSGADRRRAIDHWCSRLLALDPRPAVIYGFVHQRFEGNALRTLAALREALMSRARSH